MYMYMYIYIYIYPKFQVEQWDQNYDVEVRPREDVSGYP